MAVADGAAKARDAKRRLDDAPAAAARTARDAARDVAVAADAPLLESLEILQAKQLELDAAVEQFEERRRASTPAKVKIVETAYDVIQITASAPPSRQLPAADVDVDAILVTVSR